MMQSQKSSDIPRAYELKDYGLDAYARSSLKEGFLLTAEELRESLEELKLSQRMLSRLLRYLATSRQPNPAVVNRWATGRAPVPALLVAFLRVFCELPASRRQELTLAAEDAIRGQRFGGA